MSNSPFNSPVATFFKVSFEQYLKDYNVDLKSEAAANLRVAYDAIRLPSRATTGSAGYDFFLPVGVSLSAGDTIIVKTGIRASLRPGWFLMLLPRSGLGFKYGLSLSNTAGVIDSDYFHAENEGHIMAKLKVEKDIYLEAGDRFMQGLLLPHGYAANDRVLNPVTRKGGFGSTGGVTWEAV